MGMGKKNVIFVQVLTERTMSKILKVRNVNDYSRYVGCKEQHPLVSVIDYAEVSPVRHSLPTMQYCADKLCMSANYFGDVIKKTTGDTASNHIRQFVIQLAKNGLAAGETVSQVSDRLGFEYPQHFSRMFKKQEGITPSEYCQRMRG